MSDKLPVLKARDVAKILEKAGFRLLRQKGSHAIYAHYAHPDGRVTEIPLHQGEDIGRGLLRRSYEI
jgi:predicted RNA binding protein YcfA (HicA-like mRNA interferase family)